MSLSYPKLPTGPDDVDRFFTEYDKILDTRRQHVLSQVQKMYDAMLQRAKDAVTHIGSKVEEKKIIEGKVKVLEEEMVKLEGELKKAAEEKLVQTKEQLTAKQIQVQVLSHEFDVMTETMNGEIEVYNQKKDDVAAVKAYMKLFEQLLGMKIRETEDQKLEVTMKLANFECAVFLKELEGTFDITGPVEIQHLIREYQDHKDMQKFLCCLREFAIQSKQN